jgi:hypothetical protein
MPKIDCSASFSVVPAVRGTCTNMIGSAGSGAPATGSAVVGYGAGSAPRSPRIAGATSIDPAV